MKKFIRKSLFGVAVLFGLSMCLTSCEDVLGHWEKPAPTPITPGGTTPTVEDIIKYGFQVTDLGGVDRTEAVTSLKMSKADGTLVAEAEVSDGKITITNTKLTEAGITAAADFWFEATIDEQAFIAKVNIDPTTLSPESDKTLAMATLGNIIGADGKFYANKTAVEDAGKTGVAMIVYLGDEGETNTDYKHGLAIALSDANTGAGAKWRTSGSGTDLSKQYNTWCNTPATDAATDMAGIANTATLKGKGDDYVAAKVAGAYSVDGFTPDDYGFSGWFLPSAGQWYKFLNGMCGLTWSGFGVATGTGSVNFYAVNNAFDAAGYDTTDAMFEDGDKYWSSSECDSYHAVSVDFDSPNGVHVGIDNKANDLRVRSFLAF